MPVYVDEAKHLYRGMKMCHMMADSRGELLKMADKIGVARKWIQKEGTKYEHFDVSASKRALAIKAGAVECTSRDLCLRFFPPKRLTRNRQEPNLVTSQIITNAEEKTIMNPKIQHVFDQMKTVVDDEATPEQVKVWLGGLMNVLEDADVPAEKFLKGSELPTSTGALADEYAEVRAERLRLEKLAGEVKSRESEIHGVVLSILNESTDTGASGKKYRVQRVEKERLNVKDWPAFWSWIAKNDAFDMLQKRLAEKAAMERYQDMFNEAEAAAKAHCEAKGISGHSEEYTQILNMALEAKGLPGVELTMVPTLSFTKV